jgi:Cobalt uptake substrate-specific transmembrane region
MPTARISYGCRSRYTRGFLRSEREISIAVVLGPLMSMLSITAVLLIQALVFADGAITTLGANSFNIAGGGLCGHSPSIGCRFESKPHFA